MSFHKTEEELDKTFSLMRELVTNQEVKISDDYVMEIEFRVNLTKWEKVKRFFGLMKTHECKDFQATLKSMIDKYEK